jgi:hypothetical protein
MTDASALLDRLAAVEARLVAHAAAPLPPGLTDPDPGASERWEAGQVWAHLAEFVPYWLSQIRRVVAPPIDRPVPFGRTKSDPERIAAIERDRRTAPEELLKRVRAGIAELRAALEALPEEAWTARGLPRESSHSSRSSSGSRSATWRSTPTSWMAFAPDGYWIPAVPAPHRASSRSMSSGRMTAWSAYSPHASFGTLHITSNSLPSGSRPYSDLLTP